MKHIILVSNEAENPLDSEHRFVCLGPNCWGISTESAREAFKNCKSNAPRGADRFLTRVAHQSVQVDPVDGAFSWDATHDAKGCKLCTVGKGVGVQFD